VPVQVNPARKPQQLPSTDSTHLGLEHLTAILWFERLDKVVLRPLGAQPIHLMVVPAASRERNRCYFLSSETFTVNVRGAKTLHVGLGDREWTIEPTSNLEGKPTTSFVYLFAGQSPHSPYQIGSDLLNPGRDDATSIHRAATHAKSGNRIFSIWQSPIISAGQKMLLGPARPVWPLGGKRLITVGRTEGSHEIKFSVMADTLDLQTVSITLWAPSALQLLTWRNVIAEKHDDWIDAFWEENPAGYRLDRNALRQVEMFSPPESKYDGDEKPGFGIFAWNETVDVGDILVACALSSSDWPVQFDSESGGEGECFAIDSTLHPKKLRYLGSNSKDPPLRLLCWQVARDGLTTRRWSTIDERGRKALEAEIIRFHDTRFEPTRKWREAIRAELPPPRPGAPPLASFEDLLLFVAPEPEHLTAAQIFDLGNIGLTERVNQLFAALDPSQAWKLVRLYDGTKLPTTHAARLMPLDFANFELSSRGDWIRLDDQARRLCDTAAILWGNLYIPKPNATEPPPLPDSARGAEQAWTAITTAADLFLSEPFVREEERKKLLTMLGALNSPDAFDAAEIQPVLDALDALQQAIATAETTVISLRNHLPPQMMETSADLELRRLLCASPISVEDFSEKLNGTLSSEELKTVLNQIEATGLTQRSQARLRGVVFGLAHQVRLVREIAQCFLPQANRSEAEAYVRVLQAAGPTAALSAQQQTQLRKLASDFAYQHLAEWVGRVAAVDAQLTQELRLVEAMEQLAAGPVPLPQEIAGLRALLLANPREAASLEHALNLL